MRNFKFEIEYFYHPTTDDGPRTHWMYFQVQAKDMDAAKELAHKHYTTRMRELGWTRWTTLSEIRPPKRANDPPIQKTVTPDADSKPSRKSRTGNAKRTAGKTSGRKRTTGTSKRKPKSS